MEHRIQVHCATIVGSYHNWANQILLHLFHRGSPGYAGYGAHSSARRLSHTPSRAMPRALPDQKILCEKQRQEQ
eukprot:1139184-Pelagomonas_calceolata.AAC.8